MKKQSKFFEGPITFHFPVHPELVIEENNVMNSWEELRIREAKEGNPVPFFDNKFCRWGHFIGKTIPAITNVSTKTFTAPVNPRKRDSIAFKKLGSLLEAKIMLHQSVLNGYIDVPGFKAYYFFKIDGDSMEYFFHAHRTNDGKLSVYASADYGDNSV